MGNPGVNPRFNFEARHFAMAPRVAQTAQPVAKAGDIVFGQAAASVREKNKTQERRWPRRGENDSLPGMQLQAAAFEVTLDPRSPISQNGRIIVKERKVIDIPHIGRPQNLGNKVIEAIEEKIGEKLAGQIADGQTTAALVGRKQIIAGKVQIHWLLRVRAIDDQVQQPKGFLTGDVNRAGISGGNFV